MAPVILLLLKIQWKVMKYQRTVLGLWQAENIHGHVTYSVVINQVLCKVSSKLGFY